MQVLLWSSVTTVALEAEDDDDVEDEDVEEEVESVNDSVLGSVTWLVAVLVEEVGVAVVSEVAEVWNVLVLEWCSVEEGCWLQ